MKRLAAWLVLAALAIGLVLTVGCQQQAEQPAEQMEEMGEEAGEMTEDAGEMMEEGMEEAPTSDS